MKLKNLLKDQKYEVLQGSLDIEIDRVDFDSRLVEGKSLFSCMRRLAFDGHDYAKSAVEAGAIALLVEHEIEGISENITIVKVENAREMTAYVSNALYDFPSRKFNLIGITGTNGKTTTTYLVEAVLKAIGRKTGVIGTIENRVLDEVFESKNTTPLAPELQEVFAKMADAKVDDVVMEVTAHALDLNRVDYSEFEIGLFTNLTQDHLDDFKTMENYRNAKAKMFEMANFNIFNADDDNTKYYMSKVDKPFVTYGMEKEADFKADDVVVSSTGCTFKLVYNDENYDVKINTPGKFSVYNALAAIAICIRLGVTIEEVIKVLGEYGGVPGRFQTLVSKDGFSVVVDYAHAPDGLENVLKTAKEFTKGRLMTIVGCGGDRDKTKRPIMSGIAADFSDIVFITSDNPRTEDPESILDDVEAGIKDRGVTYTREVDREEAIKKAIKEAKKDDVIIIAGKGHEDYQIIGKEKIHFDDVEKVLENIKVSK